MFIYIYTYESFTRCRRADAKRDDEPKPCSVTKRCERDSTLYHDKRIRYYEKRKRKKQSRRLDYTKGFRA